MPLPKDLEQKRIDTLIRLEETIFEILKAKEITSSPCETVKKSISNSKFGKIAHELTFPLTLFFEHIDLLLKIIGKSIFKKILSDNPAILKATNDALDNIHSNFTTECVKDKIDIIKDNFNTISTWTNKLPTTIKGIKNKENEALDNIITLIDLCLLKEYKNKIVLDKCDADPSCARDKENNFYCLEISLYTPNFPSNVKRHPEFRNQLNDALLATKAWIRNQSSLPTGAICIVPGTRIIRHYTPGNLNATEGGAAHIILYLKVEAPSTKKYRAVWIKCCRFINEAEHNDSWECPPPHTRCHHVYCLVMTGRGSETRTFYETSTSPSNWELHILTA